MTWARKILFLVSFFISQQALAQDDYLISFGDDLWTLDLLIETCSEELEEAVAEVIALYKSLYGLDKEIVGVLPESLGYQYFRVEFKEFKEGYLIDLEEPFVFQFQYWTYRDEHIRCLKVEPHNIVD